MCVGHDKKDPLDVTLPRYIYTGIVNMETENNK
jgi:hypothetical protein